MTALIFICVAFAGIFAHWLKSWCRGQIQGGFFYWLISEPKHTIYTLMTVAGGLYTLATTGALMVVTQESLALVFLVGFSADSALNKEGASDG